MNIRLAHTRSPWATLVLQDMTVSSPSSRLYRNGRQQVELTVRLRALDAKGQCVALSDEQRDSIRLIDYDSGQPLPDVPPSGEVAQGWGATRVRNEYAFFPAAGGRERAAPRTKATGDESIVWYVQTADTRPRRIGCRVQSGATPAAGPGVSAPFVRLEPERLPAQDFARSVEYRCERESAFPRSVGRGHPVRDVDYYYCSVYVDGQRLALLSFDVMPASLMQCDDAQAPGATFAFTGFAAPGARSIRYALPSTLDALRHRIVARPRAGEGVIVLVQSEAGGADGIARLPWTSCDIDAIDEFGTSHAMRVTLERAGACRTLVLSRR
ncbi:hypothetical protein [Trinickia diaoshuihuensis]|uniref:hypothetical protein n=1 Tax=Trinickia diaoshuihuensis TaxID=2292265 RepID=UPI000E2559DD|nr:hypothetical protein [Trinickia diaoshuihuensis]